MTPIQSFGESPDPLGSPHLAPCGCFQNVSEAACTQSILSKSINSPLICLNILSLRKITVWCSQFPKSTGICVCTVFMEHLDSTSSNLKYSCWVDRWQAYNSYQTLGKSVLNTESLKCSRTLNRIKRTCHVKNVKCWCFPEKFWIILKLRLWRNPA